MQIALSRPTLPPPAAAILAALGALAAAALALWLASLLLPSAPPPARSPFGVGVAESGGGGILAWAQVLQAEYGRRLSDAVSRLRTDGGWAWLAGLSLAYGVLHAAGPGHGKAVVSAYILANGSDLRRGLLVSLGAALVQGLLAIALVLGISLAAGGPDAFRAAAGQVETAGFLAMAAFGAWLLWRKARALAAADPVPCGPGCGHGHAAPTRARGAVAAGIVAGARPCSGAILVLVLALSQGMPWAGVGSVLAMALGTALTTGAVAVASVYAKSAALRLAGGRPGPWGRVVVAGEAVVAAGVVLLGLLLALGMAGAATGALTG